MPALGHLQEDDINVLHAYLTQLAGTPDTSAQSRRTTSWARLAAACRCFPTCETWKWRPRTCFWSTTRRKQELPSVGETNVDRVSSHVPKRGGKGVSERDVARVARERGPHAARHAPIAETGARRDTPTRP
jgi:hypothetical protein